MSGGIFGGPDWRGAISHLRTEEAMQAAEHSARQRGNYSHEVPSSDS